MKTKKFYIDGMSCASCELLIEKKILEKKGVKMVDASFGDGMVVINYEGDEISLGDMNKWFYKDKYSFSEHKLKEKKEPLFYFVAGSGLKINKEVMMARIKTLSVFVIILVVLSVLFDSKIAQLVSVNESSSLGVFFLFGLVAGVSSCAALIGGLLLSLTKSWNYKIGKEATWQKKMIPHMFFHTGRIISYLVFGLLLGALGKAVLIESSIFYVLVTMIVSVVMGIVGLQMLGVRWAERLQIRVPKFITKKVIKNNSTDYKKTPFLIGAGTIILPCGFTLIAQTMALTSGSAVRGASILVAFVLGNLLPLLIIGLFGARGLSSPKWGKRVSLGMGTILVIFAVYNLNSQLNVLSIPSLNDVKIDKSELSFVAVDENNVQVVKIIAEGFSYTPQGGTSIKAGIPTRLEVDNRGVLGCGASLSVGGLLKGYTSLKSGKNIIDLGSPKKGKYKITCSMGMVSPVILVVD